MIQTEKQHAITIHQSMMNINKKHQLEYHPWKNFTKFRAEKKQTIIDNVKQWNTVFKSIVVDGFQDNNDKVLMNFHKGQSGEEKKTQQILTLVYQII
jgi:hypothetical protein